jgi:acyl carrier protein
MLDLELTSVPIGRPIGNTRVYVLDQHQNPVPVGVPGELYIGGDGVALGYLNLPEMTSERFVPDLFNPDLKGRLYRTGDLARYRRDGNLEFLGRLDGQVKIRGFRIEPEEVEAVLLGHDAVNEAIVLDRRELPGEGRLVAYIVSGHSPPPNASELRDFIKRKLPEYMIPSAFICLSAFPRNANGKIDRKALPAPGQNRPDLEETYLAPMTPVEKAIAGIWSKVLGLQEIGIHDDFFALGGHSLLATMIISRINEAFHLKVPMRCLFDFPTVAEFALEIVQIMTEEAGSGATMSLPEI